MTTTTLVRQHVPPDSPATWEARAAWWSSRVLFWAFLPERSVQDNESLENAIQGMRDARRAAQDRADFLRIFGQEG